MRNSYNRKSLTEKYSKGGNEGNNRKRGWLGIQ